MPLRARSKLLMTVTLLASSGMLLSGCVTDGSFATLKGASTSFVAPKYQVLGKTQYDQKWIDQTTEAGVAGFGWKRPAKRPASLNPKPVAAKVEAVDQKSATFKKRWYYRFLPHKAAK